MSDEAIGTLFFCCIFVVIPVIMFLGQKASHDAEVEERRRRENAEFDVEFLRSMRGFGSDLKWIGDDGQQYDVTWAGDTPILTPTLHRDTEGEEG